MAIGIKETWKLSDVLNGVTSQSDISVEFQTVIRIEAVRFPSKKRQRSLEIDFSIAGPTETETLTVKIDAESTPASPREDIVDPRDGSVVVPAGSVVPPLPSLEQLRSMPVEIGGASQEFGTVMDQIRGAAYVLVQKLNPAWQGDHV